MDGVGLWSPSNFHELSGPDRHDGIDSRFLISAKMRVHSDKGQLFVKIEGIEISFAEAYLCGLMADFTDEPAALRTTCGGYRPFGLEEPTMRIDLEPYTRGAVVKNLSGSERGRDARKHFGLDVIDRGGQPISVSIPDNVYAISSSFFCGMFGDSYSALGRAGFLKVYRFDVPAVILPQIEQGLQRCAIRYESPVRSRSVTTCEDGKTVR